MRTFFLLLVFIVYPRVMWAIVVDGSSTVYPITEAIAESYQDDHPQEGQAARLVVSVSGTGGGFQRLCRGEADIVDASRPILRKEMISCQKAGIGYIELPVAYDAIAVTVNPRNTFIHEIGLSGLHHIWGASSESRVLYWDQVNSAYPHQVLHLYGPGPGSGTFDYFTTVVNKKSGSIRSDFSASQNDDVLVQGVARDEHALSYFGYAYYVNNQAKLRLLPVRSSAEHPPVFPSLLTICNGQYALARPLFIYVSSRASKNFLVRRFVHYYLTHAARFVHESGYFPLDKKLYFAIDQRFKRKIEGTVYGGDFARSANLDIFLNHL